MKPVILIHYHEIALKGKNRPFFERKLLQNIKKALKGRVNPNAVKREYGRLVIQLKADKAGSEHFAKEIGKREHDFVANASPKGSEHVKKKIVKCKRDFRLTASPITEIPECLKRVFGIAYFAPAYQTEPSIRSFCQAAQNLLQEEKFTTFKVQTRRSDKKFPLSSQEINEKVGRFIQEKFKKKVNLANPDLTVYLETGLKKAFVYTKKIPGVGGLPVSSAGKVASLISPGFDSPVASWYLMKRGAKVIFIHFCSFPCLPENSKTLVKKIIKILNLWQFDSTLYLVPFHQIHNTLVQDCPSSLLCVLCKRMMVRIAEMLARREKAKALVTGESLGQVASQTLPNLKVINKVATMPIFRPLIGMDKQEIINKAKEIGTYEISSSFKAHSIFKPTHITTAAKLKEVEQAEKSLNIPKLLKETLGKVKKKKLSSC